MLRRAYFLRAAAVAAGSIVHRTITEKDIATHLKMAKVEELQTMKPNILSWVSINSVARAQLSSLLETYPQQSFLTLRKSEGCVVAAKPLAAPKGPQHTLLAEWKTRSFPTLVALAEYYESVVAPALDLLHVIDKHTLLCYSYRDVLKLKRATAEVLGKTKKLLEESEATIEKSKKALQEYMKTVIDTSVYNSLINIYRIAGEKDEHSANYAQQLLDDMGKLGVEYDSCTQLLLRNVCFGDACGDDSDMLFAYVEYPETGEVTLVKDSVTEINSASLEIISQRHNIELTSGGLHLTDTSTFPNLPRAQ